MTKQEIERELKKYNQGAMSINQSELMRARHKGREWVKAFTSELPFWREGKTVEYPLKAVVDKMFEEMNGRRL